MKKLSFFQNSAEVHIIGSNDFIGSDTVGLPNFVSVLSEKEKQKYYSFSNEEAKYTYLTAHANLRFLLEKKLGVSPNKIRVETTPNNKPFLPDFPKLFFNISHTKGMVLIAFSGSPIGVDVERLDRKTDYDSIIKHFFSEREVKNYLSIAKEMRKEAFFRGWTRKEAILKAVGEGLRGIRKYEISFALKDDTTESYDNCQKVDFAPEAGFCACLALVKQRG